MSERDEFRELIDLAHRAIDALSSTTTPPRDLPDWLWDVGRELHRVGGHAEAPDPETTQRLHDLVERAYDSQVTDPSWWRGHDADQVRAEIDRRVDEHDHLVQRLRGGDVTALTELFKAVLGARIIKNDASENAGDAPTMKRAADVAADILRDPEARDEIDAIKAALLGGLGVADEPLTEVQHRIQETARAEVPDGSEAPDWWKDDAARGRWWVELTFPLTGNRHDAQRIYDAVADLLDSHPEWDAVPLGMKASPMDPDDPETTDE